MKKLFKSLSVFATIVLCFLTLPTFAADTTVTSSNYVVLDETGNPPDGCEGNRCIVCNENGCTIVVLSLVDTFKLDTLNDMKVAPRDPQVRCNRFPKPGCPNYIPPDDELSKSNTGLIELLKLKCKKAGTCRKLLLDSTA